MLREVSLDARAGEAVAVIGPNGAGKTTLLKSIVGMLRPSRGRVHFEGRPLDGLRAFEVARLGLAYVPAERELFPTHDGAREPRARRLCAKLAERRRQSHLDAGVRICFRASRSVGSQLAGTMSGGEQQMLAIGRALMAGPKVLLLDEPSTGLAPKAVAELYRQPLPR